LITVRAFGWLVVLSRSQAVVRRKKILGM